MTEADKPAYVLLGIGEYQRLAPMGRSVLEALAMPGLGDIDFDPPRVDELARAADLD